MDKKINQTFVSLSFTLFLQQPQHQCQSAGIYFQTNQESYTSTCSLLDGKVVEHHERYLGKCIHRGLFHPVQNILLNADMNAVYTIIRNVCLLIRL